MGISFYLTAVGNNFLSTRLIYYKLLGALNNVFVRYGACLRAEGKRFGHLILNVASKRPVLTAVHQSKTRGLRQRADWNRVERPELSDKVISVWQFVVV